MELVNWIIKSIPGVNIDTLTQLKGDASLRRYFRVATKHDSFIIMDTSFDRSMVSFIRLNKLLELAGLSVPAILKMDVRLGFLVLQDLGDVRLFDIINTTNCDQYYKIAITELIKMQKIQELNHWDLVKMDYSYIQDRMRIFKYWFLLRRLNINESDSLNQMLDNLSELFLQNIAQQPQVFVHHDYHSKNIMVGRKDVLSILDFQDGIIGPYSYDLASLLEDAYLTWPISNIDNWLTFYADLAVREKIISPEHDIKRDMEITGLSRHLKNLGIFARLYYRDNKPSYLNYIPVLMDYITRTCAKHPELAPLYNFMQEAIIPTTIAADLESPNLVR
jgi:aminoglycoside/choline kinase family phosphotransferase